MSETEKKHLDYVVRRFYDGKEMALAKEVWVETHPALLDAKKRTAHAKDEEEVVGSVLREMWEEVHEAIYPYPDEGYLREKVLPRDHGREARLLAIKVQTAGEHDKLRDDLKQAIAKYGIKVPDRVPTEWTAQDTIDEKFGHLAVSKDAFIDEFGAKYPDTGDGPRFGCHAVMDAENPHLEAVLFMPPEEVEVPATFRDFPVKVVDGRKTETPKVTEVPPSTAAPALLDMLKELVKDAPKDQSGNIDWGAVIGNLLGTAK
jgi:hypothetical protein